MEKIYSNLSDREVLSRVMSDAEFHFDNIDGDDILELRTSELERLNITQGMILEILACKHPFNTKGNISSVLVSKLVTKYSKYMWDDFHLHPSWNWSYNYIIELYGSSLEALWNRASAAYPRNPMRKQTELAIELILEILTQSKSTRFRQQHNRLINRSKQNFRKARSYLNALFRNYTKLLVLRLDLSWKSEFAKDMTVEMARETFKHFMNNQRRNQLFSSCVGYIAKMEYGIEKAHHFHVVFFLDGQLSHKAEYLAQQFGKYWEAVVTKGQGMFFNCHSKKLNFPMYEYKRHGIGMVNHLDVEKRDFLLNDVIAYFCKNEQFLCAKEHDKGYRLFSTGIHRPQIRLNKAGRPRKQLKN